MQQIGLYLTATAVKLPFPHWMVANSTDTQNLCSGAGLDCSNDKSQTAVGLDLPHRITSITGLLLEVAGAVAVIIIIVGGITYVTSTGDSARVKQAKDTILYAIIGLVVAILAFAIVQFISVHIT